LGFSGGADVLGATRRPVGTDEPLPPELAPWRRVPAEQPGQPDQPELRGRRPADLGGSVAVAAALRRWRGAGQLLPGRPAPALGAGRRRAPEPSGVLREDG